MCAHKYQPDPSGVTLGGRPTQLYNPLRDTSIPEDERGTRFCHWISCYFTAIDDLEEVTESKLVAREALHEAKGSTQTHFNVKPSLDRMTDNEYKSVVDPTVFNRSYVSLRSLAQGDTYGENLRKALFDTDGIWPDIDVLFLWCNMSVSDCIFGAKHVLDLSKKAEGNGHIARPVKLVKIPNANHFVRLQFVHLCFLI